MVLNEMSLYDEQKIKGYIVQHFRGVTPSGQAVSHVIATHPVTGKKTTLYHGPTDKAPAMKEDVIQSEAIPFIVEVNKTGFMLWEYSLSLFGEILTEGKAFSELAAYELAKKLADSLQESYDSH